ncbi:hypothetical protein LCGC14_0446300 [marine sediment metagenome]|uniref:Uncharacterized protein n=1 Tax=marine sediment metagenome TaxID=412755 RepID=A0A0F9SJ07_9ZZZZ
MRIAYEAWRPGAQARATVVEAESICAEYVEQGYDLTLRQLYYQFVSRGLLSNTQRSYSNLGTTVNRARLAGLLDWDYIVDRTRNLQSVAHWDSPADMVDACAKQFTLDKWTDQSYRIEVWVEKEALAGVIGKAAEASDIAWFACRGYVSQSEMWGAAQRLLKYIEGGQAVRILHLGDHDPSGIDMTRDIAQRLQTFVVCDYARAHREDFVGEKITVGLIMDHMKEHCGGRVALEIRRIAFNWEQVQEYSPPPNPTKLTDSRAKDYIQAYGSESWELDALDPSVLERLIDDEIQELRNEILFAEREQEQAGGRVALRRVAEELNGADAS